MKFFVFITSKKSTLLCGLFSVLTMSCAELPKKAGNESSPLSTQDDIFARIKQDVDANLEQLKTAIALDPAAAHKYATITLSLLAIFYDISFMKHIYQLAKDQQNTPFLKSLAAMMEAIMSYSPTMHFIENNNKTLEQIEQAFAAAFEKMNASSDIAEFNPLEEFSMSLVNHIKEKIDTLKNKYSH